MVQPLKYWGPSKRYKKGERKVYDRNSIQKALDFIKNGSSIREASRKFNVPRATLQDRIHGRVSEDCKKMGRLTVLNTSEEDTLVAWLLEIAKRGFPRKKWHLINSVKKIIVNEKRPNPFKDQTPGQKWYDLFMRRHPELRLGMSKSIKTRPALIGKEVLKTWYSGLIQYLTETGNLDILEDPKRILNGDEICFDICPKTGRVIGPKDFINIYEVKSGRVKETITVMIIITAAGEMVTPMVVFPYVQIPSKELVDSVPPEWILGISESGSMNSDVFYDYMVNGVNVWLGEANIKKPFLLFVDPHKTLLTHHLSVFCDTNGIILYALPPKTTSPTEVSVFNLLKSEWTKTMSACQNTKDKPFTKLNFCPLLQKVLQKDMTQIIINGFETCGLYPFDVNAVDYINDDD